MRSLDEIIDSAVKLARLGDITNALGRLELAEFKNNAASNSHTPYLEFDRVRGRIAAAEDFAHRCNAGLEE